MPSPALTAACTALTSEDLPMPRAPHSSALLAGRPRAKRSVFSTRMSRTRSMPLSSDMSTRLTRGTGRELAGIGLPDEGVGGGEIGRLGGGGASRSSAAAMRCEDVGVGRARASRRRTWNSLFRSLPIAGRGAAASRFRSAINAGARAGWRPFRRAHGAHCNRAAGRYSPRKPRVRPTLFRDRAMRSFRGRIRADWAAAT